MIKSYQRNLLLGISVFAFAALSGCSKDSSSDDTTLVGNWVRKGDFEGVARSEAVSAELNGKEYAGLGFDGTTRLKDFWVYDPATDFWERKADFPGVARNSGVAFSAAGKIYVGLGFDGVNKLNDFWAYDPASNSWAQVANFGGSARYSAKAFSISDKGYVVSGYDGSQLKDFWKYDPLTNIWTQEVSPGGSKRSDAVVFVINNRAYLATGINNGSYINDFWMYNPEGGGTWTEKTKISNVSDDDYDDDYTIVRSNAVAFSINGKGYITTGTNGSYTTTTWEYDPGTDRWTAKTGFQGTAREGAIGFNVGNRGFVALGRSSSYRFDDVRELSPDAAEVDTDD
jgi:N-acetylneuraminic acid mutarotase